MVLVREQEILETGRFVPVNNPTEVLCVAWQECEYENCTQATRVLLQPIDTGIFTMSETRATLLFFSAFGGSFLSLVTLFALFLICVDCCSHERQGKSAPPEKKSPSTCSPVESIRSLLKYLNTKTSVVKRRSEGKRPALKDVKFSPVPQEGPSTSQNLSHSLQNTNQPISDEQHNTNQPISEECSLPTEISPESKPSRHLSWDGTFENELLDELDEIVIQCNLTEFETESLCSGCNDLRENCVRRSSVSACEFKGHSEGEETEGNLGRFFSASELSDLQKRFLSPVENDYETLGSDSRSC